MRVEWPVEDVDLADGGGIISGWDCAEPPVYCNYSDLGMVSLLNTSFDAYGFDGIQWYDDTLAELPGENNVEGAAAHDGANYWFELRKELDSGDGYDFAFSPGQFVDTGVLGLIVRDNSEDIGYGGFILLQLAAPPPSTVVYFNLNPNPVGVGETVTLKGVLLTEFSQPVSGETVKLYARPLTGSWKLVTSLETNTRGVFTWQAKIPVEGLFVFVVYYPGSEVYESSYNVGALIVQ
jgi:hypothetical protein